MARKMKDSGIEWIGEIPEGWEVLAHNISCTKKSQSVSIIAVKM